MSLGAVRPGGGHLAVSAVLVSNPRWAPFLGKEGVEKVWARIASQRNRTSNLPRPRPRRDSGLVVVTLRCQCWVHASHTAQANSFSSRFLPTFPSFTLPAFTPPPSSFSMSVDEEAAQKMEGGKMQTVIDRGMAEAGQRKGKSGQRPSHPSHRQRVINSPELTGRRNDSPSLLYSAVTLPSIKLPHYRPLRLVAHPFASCSLPLLRFRVVSRGRRRVIHVDTTHTSLGSRPAQQVKGLSRVVFLVDSQSASGG